MVHPVPSDLEVILSKLAGLKTNVERSLAGEISYTGTGYAQTGEYIQRYFALAESLRSALPDVYGDIPQRQWYVSIASQKEALRDLNRDIDYILSQAAQLGHYRPVILPTGQAQPSTAVARSGNWIADHLSQIVIALIVAFLVFLFGWN
ncbi:MAG: hypothetical protein H0U13_13030 [Gemmatimonadaceae bacterium]|nr:hypothetical protein [Gemmatimonadaceae bacterium]